jgi:hypothetical protein
MRELPDKACGPWLCYNPSREKMSLGTFGKPISRLDFAANAPYAINAHSIFVAMDRAGPTL